MPVLPGSWLTVSDVPILYPKLSEAIPSVLSELIYSSPACKKTCS